MCFVKVLWGFRLVCLWAVAFNNPIPASQVRIQQFRVIERFCVEGSNKRSDRGHSSNDLEFLTDHAFRASFSDLRKLNNVFHFLSLQWERGPRKWIGLGKWFSNCGTRTTSGTRRPSRWYANRPTFCFSSRKIYSHL